MSHTHLPTFTKHHKRKYVSQLNLIKPPATGDIIISKTHAIYELWAKIKTPYVWATDIELNKWMMA